MEQGIYRNIPFKDYLEIDAVNSSYLKLLSEVPAKAKIPIDDTPQKKFGRAVHSYILDGTKSFFRDYAIIGKIDKRTKAGKEEYAIFETENAGKEVITHLEYGQIKAMHEAVMTHPFASELLKQGESEVTVVWQDQETGLLCKCRPDRIPTGSGVFLDLKSTKSADRWLFRRDLIYFKYYWSAAFYMEGLGIVTGELYDNFAFIALEKEPPYRVEVWTIPNNFLARGYDSIHYWLREEVKFRANNHWPHYKNAGADEIPMPQYLEGETE